MPHREQGNNTKLKTYVVKRGGKLCPLPLKSTSKGAIYKLQIGK